MGHSVQNHLCILLGHIHTVHSIFSATVTVCLPIPSVSSDICAALVLDNNKVGHTDWKPPSNHAWDQVFNVALDKVSGLVMLT